MSKTIWLTERPGPQRLHAGTALAAARAHRIIRAHRNGGHRSPPPPASERWFTRRLYATTLD